MKFTANGSSFTRSFFAIALSIALAPVSPVWAADDESQSLALSIEPTMNSGDADALSTLCGQLTERVEESKSNSARYASAFCNYRLATLLMSTGSSKPGAMLEKAQADLEEVLKTAEEGTAEHAEALALQAGVMGFRISVDPGLSMSLGSRSSRLLAKVGRMAPENPRVQLQVGVSKFNTPKMFGGSKKKAEQALRKSVSLFADAGASEQWPNWGYTDALAWLGQTLMEQGKIDEARAAYQQALAINPEMAWVKYELLPALNRKAGE